MLPKQSIYELIKPFTPELSDAQVDQILVYLDLLLRWNQKINLTAIRDPKECLTRHFGESFLLSKAITIAGKLLDVGSGAGFPGLALKILVPEVTIELLEPVGKKRAFLKEVINVCGLKSIHVSGNRIEELAQETPHAFFDIVTARAVGNLPQIVPSALACLKPSGHICLWLSAEQEQAIRHLDFPISWNPSVPVPLARQRVILVGNKL